MSFVRATGFVLSTALIAATTLCGNGHAAEAPAPAEFGAVPGAQPIPPATKPQNDDSDLTPEQAAAQKEALGLMEEISAALNADDLKRAEPLLAKAEATLRRADLFNADMEHTVRLGQGMIEMKQERYEAAERSFRAALAAAVRAGDKDNEPIAKLHMCLVSVMLPRSNFAAVKPLLDVAYPIYRKLDDPNDDMARTNLMCLMLSEAELNHPDRAAAYAWELCDYWRRAKDGDGSERIVALRALVRFQLELRDIAGARNSLDEAADVSVKVNGPKHAETVELRNWADQIAELFKRSEQWGKLVVEAKQLADGLDVHSKQPEVLQSNVPKLQRLVEISKQIDRPSEGRMKWVFMLAGTYDQLGDAPNAVRLYREYAATMDRDSTDLEGEKTAALLRLARAEANLGNLSQARVYTTRVADYYGSDPNSAKMELLARKYLTYIECASGAWPAALDHLERYVELTRVIHRERLENGIAFRAQHAYVCGVDPKLHDRCRAILDEACRTSAETFGRESAEAGTALQWLAMFQYRAGDAACIDTLTAADRILTVTRDDTDVGAGYRRLRIAKYHRAFGRLDQARALYETELKRLGAEPYGDANRQAIALGFLAGIDAHQGRKPEAEQGYREAVRLVSAHDDDIAKDLAPFFSKQCDELAAGKLPGLAPAENGDDVGARIVIP